MDSLSQKMLLELVESRRFGVEYQPIVELKTGDFFAYEALSRFRSLSGELIRPDYVYAALHDNPLLLFQVELAQKKIQLECLSNSERVFVNLDQDAFYACGQHAEDNPFVELIQAAGRDRVVVELIENSEISDALMSLSMIELFNGLGIRTALDDLCNPKSMLSVAVLQLVEWVKLDKCVLEKRLDANFMVFVSKIIDFAHATGKQVILEGVEVEEDLAFARRIGVDYVQGFYFRSGFLSH
ncbi:MAG: EAL domain-containing protein [Gammaproteobacteria bacterium]|jgi:EAL domain-containing protein (putative c-di-GMP-specific phosphodiesterase class I)|uniref:EAL domain-containing protein n=1 Tax=Marinomonas TaxID=28253 RepID=UPI000C2926FC|nr:EAL domain-containing protein [Marinomonas sp. ef1]MBU1297297.1 EAL domain-containing protein [Gammaproteobacteria bacterium]MBU1468061.1 EAL domain-containing protein [Gammaproteobacteria bacterium]MBU2024165.1 EAL domain-containing protein [Gammaproteobacteria bacterium]MBU2240803.1 EAL domain-containing protein [Gammaproteobacteria bacterium]MBU2318435.1 EAL domain-containing protein [Gammaproteobacteria bacterium]